MPLTTHPTSDSDRRERVQTVSLELLERAFEHRRALETARLRLNAAIEADDSARIESATADITRLSWLIRVIADHLHELGGLPSARLDEVKTA